MNKTNKKFKDPGSAITHLIAMIGAVICAFPLIGKAVHTNNSIVVFAMSVFISSMILLYGASTLYHSLDISKKVNLFFRRIDHSMIFVLIAGSYTPVCLLALDRKQGIPLLVLVWATAIIGIIIKIFFINCPHWVSSIIYIGMGWTCVLVFKPLLANLPARIHSQQQRRKAQILQRQMVVMLSLPSVVEVSWTVQKRLHF